MNNGRRTAIRRVVAAVAVVAVIGIGAGSPASAGGTADIAVTKVVEGTAPTDAEFVIEVACVQPINPSSTTSTSLTGAPVAVRGPVVNDPPFTVELTFGSTGGTQNVIIGSASVCTMTEIDNGGADSNTGPVVVDVEEPIPYSASITNTFDPEPTTTGAPTTAAPTTAAAAAAVAQTPTFTG